MVKESIQYYITILEDLSQLCSNGKLGEFAKIQTKTNNLIGHLLALYNDPRLSEFKIAFYLVELISQLEDDALVSLIFKQNPELYEKFPENAYANDPTCLKFLQLTKFDPSIFKFKSFSFGTGLKSGASYCQLTSKYLITLVEHNDFAAPIQFDLSNIRNLQSVGNQARFNLARAAKKALINIDGSESTVIVLTFDSEKTCKGFMSKYQDFAGQITLSTPRKISVVQDFIALSGGFGDMDYDEDIYDGPSQNDENIEPSAMNNEVSNSGIIDETESLFGSPINTTKDTSVSKKLGRAVSVIVSESVDKGSKMVNPQLKAQDLFSDDGYQQVPDSLDQAFETFHNPPVDRGPSDVVVESNQPEDPKPAKATQKSDIWDFESDPDVTLNNPQATSTVNKKKNEPKKKTEVKSKVNDKLEKFNKSGVDHAVKDIPSSLDSIDQHGGSFLPLTSPMASAHERARTRALSKALINSEHEAPGVTENKNMAKVETNVGKRIEKKTEKKIDKETEKKPVKRGKKRAKDLEAESDVEYIEEKPAPKKGKVTTSKAVKKEVATKAAPRVTRGKKKQSEAVEVEPIKEIKLANALPSKPKAQETFKTVNKSSKVNVPEKSDKSTSAIFAKPDAPKGVAFDKNHPVMESTRLIDLKDRDKTQSDGHASTPAAQPQRPQTHLEQHFSLMSSAFTAPIAADTILSEAYTNTLQRQIFESITSFSNQLVKKIHIINDEINKKVMTDLTSKYETLFNELRDSFQSDVDEMCGFITDVKGLLNLPEKELTDYIKQKKFGSISSKK
ncbi:unnamed protein product [Wickerhamomyces anomalus]